MNKTRTIEETELYYGPVTRSKIINSLRKSRVTAKLVKELNSEYPRYIVWLGYKHKVDIVHAKVLDAVLSDSIDDELSYHGIYILMELTSAFNTKTEDDVHRAINKIIDVIEHRQDLDRLCARITDERPCLHKARCKHTTIRVKCKEKKERPDVVYGKNGKPLPNRIPTCSAESLVGYIYSEDEVRGKEETDVEAAWGFAWDAVPEY